MKISRLMGKVWILLLVVAMIGAVGCSSQRGTQGGPTVGEDSGPGESGDGTIPGDEYVGGEDITPQRADVPIGDFTDAPTIDGRTLVSIYFDYDKYEIKDGQLDNLLNNLAFLQDNTNYYILLEGHCDERGTDEYNIALADRRAVKIMQELSNRGAEAARLYTISYGEETPAVEGHDESAWKWNRRVDFKVYEK